MASTLNSDNGVVSGSAGLKSSADSTGVLALQTNGTTAISIDASQAVTFAGTVSLSGNQTTTGNLTVNGNTTLGDASTDTILMTGAPSIGGAGLGMGMGFRNRIINGAMVIDQRNAGAAIASPSDNYTTDRFYSRQVGGGVASAQQSSTAPTGFVNSLLFTVTTVDSSLSAGDRYYVAQFIEGYNIADFGWGTASAATVTLSFWVRSSLTGTFGGALNNGGTRSYPFTYTINAANTFEQKTITIAGDTSGTWATTSATGLQVFFSLGTGSTYIGTAGSWSTNNYITATGATNVIATNGATFYITGVQLEKGSTATSFDYRPIGTELALCQRYYVRWNASDVFSYFTSGLCFDSSSAVVALSNPVQMRAQPTWGAPSNCRLYNGNIASLITSISVNRSSVLVSSGNFTTGSTSFVQSNPIVVSANNNSAAYLEVTAEL